PNSSSFSVSVVLPASGCEMIANVRRRRVWARWSDISRRLYRQGSEVISFGNYLRPHRSRLANKGFAPEGAPTGEKGQGGSIAGAADLEGLGDVLPVEGG